MKPHKCPPHLFPIGSRKCVFCDELNTDTFERWKTLHRDRI